MKYNKELKRWENSFLLAGEDTCNCIICGLTAYRIQEGEYDIWFCKNCYTKFCTPRIPPDYDKVTKDNYSEYIEFSKKLKETKKEDLIEVLNVNAITFGIPLHFLEGRSGLKILEVGCSYGYFTHALRELGHDVYGIDVSKDAIDFAKREFGNFYGMDARGMYDVIISIECIEHVENPLEFIEKYMGMLNPGGSLVLTTPNLEFYFKVFWQQLQGFATAMEGYKIPERLKLIESLYEDYMWVTDKPPIHMTLFSTTSFIKIAEMNKFKVGFIDLHKKKNQMPPILGVVLTK